jgi:hypothetical protein
MASLRLKILLVSRAVFSIILLFVFGAIRLAPGRACMLAALATVFSIFDMTLLVKYNYLNNNILGKTRSTRGTIVMMTSLTSSSLALVSSFFALYVDALEGDRSTSYIYDTTPGTLVVVCFTPLGFHILTVSVIFIRYLRLFCIPVPKRLPRDYKPFNRASSISEMEDLEGNGSSSDGPLTALFLFQEKYRQGAISTHQVCNFTTNYLRHDIDCSIKSDADNINDQLNDDILRSRECQIFLRPKVI